MKIYVTDNDEKLEVGKDRTELIEYLSWSSEWDYKDLVMRWFDSGHEVPFVIQNGTVTDTWMVEE